jgi:hypothetical protein
MYWKMAVFWAVEPCSLAEVYRRLKGAWPPHRQAVLQGSSSPIINFTRQHGTEPRRQPSSYLQPWEPKVPQITITLLLFIKNGTELTKLLQRDGTFVSNFIQQSSHWWGTQNCFCLINLSTSGLISVVAVAMRTSNCSSLRRVLVIDLTSFNKLNGCSQRQLLSHAPAIKTTGGPRAEIRCYRVHQHLN